MSAHTGASALLALVRAGAEATSEEDLASARRRLGAVLGERLRRADGRVAPVARALGVSHLAVRALAQELGVTIESKPGRPPKPEAHHLTGAAVSAKRPNRST